VTVRRRVIVSGHVQGVFFRDTTESEAERAGVAGWVRNRDDGTVEAVFEGPEAAVSALVGWCGRGPSGASVADVSVEDEAPEGLAGFEVR